MLGLGLGLGVTKTNYPFDGADDDCIVFFRQSDFANGLDTAEADSVQGDLTIEYGQTAPGSVYDDWLKCTYDTAQADPGGQSGLRFNGFVSPPDQNNDTFIEDYDNNANYFIALAVDLYIEEGFDGTNNTGVRTDLYAGGSYYFARDIDGNGGAGQTVVVPQGQHVRDYASKSGSATGERWNAMGLNASNGDITLLFATPSDYPDASAVFYVRNLRVAISSCDKGYLIPNPDSKVIEYFSDFSSSVDGWSTEQAPNTAISSGVTAHGFDDLIEWSWSDDQATPSPYLKRAMDSRINQHGSKIDKDTDFVRRCTISYDIYYEDNTSPAPVSPVNANAFVGGFGSNGDATGGVGISVNEWNSVQHIDVLLDEASNDNVYIGIGNADDWPQDGDKIYYKNIQISFNTIDPEP